MNPQLPRILLLTGLTTIIVGIVLTILLGVIWPMIAVVVGISDLVIAAVLQRSSERAGR